MGLVANLRINDVYPKVESYELRRYYRNADVPCDDLENNDITIRQSIIFGIHNNNDYCCLLIVIIIFVLLLYIYCFVIVLFDWRRNCYELHAKRYLFHSFSFFIFFPFSFIFFISYIFLFYIFYPIIAKEWKATYFNWFNFFILCKWNPQPFFFFFSFFYSFFFILFIHSFFKNEEVHRQALAAAGSWHLIIFSYLTPVFNIPFDMFKWNFSLVAQAMKLTQNIIIEGISFLIFLIFFLFSFFLFSFFFVPFFSFSLLLFTFSFLLF